MFVLVLPSSSRGETGLSEMGCEEGAALCALFKWTPITGKSCLWSSAFPWLQSGLRIIDPPQRFPSPCKVRPGEGMGLSRADAVCEPLTPVGMSERLCLGRGKNATSTRARHGCETVLISIYPHSKLVRW